MLTIISNTFPMEKRVFAMFCWQERWMKRLRPEVRGHWPLRETQSKSQTHSWDTHCQRTTWQWLWAKACSVPLRCFSFQQRSWTLSPLRNFQWPFCLQSGLQPVWVVAASVTSGLTWSLGPRAVFLVCLCTAVCPFLLGSASSLILFKNKKPKQVT